jgi:hypothetical protein
MGVTEIKVPTISNLRDFGDKKKASCPALDVFTTE